MRTLTVLHRWFGVAFCLLFAMWFATGAVMHWVPFPELSEGERVAGRVAPATAAKLTPAQALAAFDRGGITRLRLTAPGGHPIYIATQSSGTVLALDAVTGSAPLIDETFALASATAHARARGLTAIAPRLVETAEYDQWTVSNGLDPLRPLHRVALNDTAGTELYVSSLTGEVVRDSTRFERAWNYAGSVLHWIYPTALRKHWAAWDALVWWLSLAAFAGAVIGLVLGITRLRGGHSPFTGWQYWHHIGGLACALFVLTWIASGWLSMDHGRIFSDGRADPVEIDKIAGAPLTGAELSVDSPTQFTTIEIEWFRFAGRIHQTGVRGGIIDGVSPGGTAYGVGSNDVLRAAVRLGADCTVADDNDAYAAHSRIAGAPVYRIVCGDNWWQIDGADGRIIEKLDASRRAYRWAFRALHTLDFPALTAHPLLRDALIMLLCAAGFAFSLTGVAIGWRRLRARAVVC